MNVLLLMTGAVFTIVWGVAHLFPTKSVVKGFGEISEDNKRIITMEWINEGLTLIFLGLLIILSTILGEAGSQLTFVIHLAVSTMLIAMSILSLFTGFKISFIPFKLCPVIFSLSAILILLGTFI